MNSMTEMYPVIELFMGFLDFVCCSPFAGTLSQTYANCVRRMLIVSGTLLVGETNHLRYSICIFASWGKREFDKKAFHG